MDGCLKVGAGLSLNIRLLVTSQRTRLCNCRIALLGIGIPFLIALSSSRPVFGSCGSCGSCEAGGGPSRAREGGRHPPKSRRPRKPCGPAKEVADAASGAN